MSTKFASIVLEEVTDPEQLAQARVRQERFERNWAWFEAHAAEIYPRGIAANAFALPGRNYLSPTRRKKCWL